MFLTDTLIQIMKNKFSIMLLLAMIILHMSSCCNTNDSGLLSERTVMSLRLRQTSTESDAKWAETYAAIKENPGVCDDVWFATGLNIISPEFHKEHATRLIKAKQQLNELGIAASLQFQMTIGHGDSFGEDNNELFSHKTWGGWTGSLGVEAKYCNCPRQPEFLKYMRELAAIYAPLHFHSLWIDDDLRYHNHIPATNGSLLGCWCDTCIKAFNREHKTEWTRESLARAVESDPVMYEQWWRFSTASLQEVARVICEEFVKVSPETQLGFQHTNYAQDIKYQEAIIQTMKDVSGKAVLYRPGGGNYYDWSNADGQITKSMTSVSHMKSIDNKNIKYWCPEIESWPRVYGSRTARSIQIEGFTALAYGADAISYFVIAGEKEDASLYSYSLLRPLSEASDVIRGYLEANKGTLPIGYVADVKIAELYHFGRSALPILPGKGVSLGKLDSKDMVFEYTTQTSKQIQAHRELIDSLHPSPVLCIAPYIGLMIPRVDSLGRVRTIAFVNTRIDSQYRIKVRINSDIDKAVWYEMREKPINLSIVKDNGCSYIEIPEIQPWNCGYIELQ